eukprot:gnl/Trimastix_PCT/530.p1 GENE.gnl/Trimastix_PCT/530~~gnl/Trimastix_PCT/530.p1  ORF type:complete len:223 (+),score=52.55 gnl/Trimastix_PCT/530:84-752(+)
MEPSPVEQTTEEVSKLQIAPPAAPAPAPSFAMRKKKKKKSSKAKGSALAELSAASAAQQDVPWADSDRDYTYEEILGRIFKKLREANPDQDTDSPSQYVLMPPQIIREGKKTLFANFEEICRHIHRQMEHVQLFLLTELACKGNLTANNVLVIRDRFQPKQIENVLKRYLREFVRCNVCKRFDTVLTKDGRMCAVQCGRCGVSRTVAKVKQGAVPEKRSRRR